MLRQRFVPGWLALFAVLCLCTHARDLTKADHLRLDKNPNQWGIRWLEGLPQKAATSAPTSSKWSNSFGICAVMKDEELADVQEWLRYYRWLGVDHIYLTDNGSDGWDAMQATLRAEFASSFLTLRSEAFEHAQLKVYAWCAETQYRKHDWLAFFDLDEYLVLRGDAAPKKAGAKPDLKAFMDGYKHTAALAVSWVWVGPSGQRKRPAEGGVMRTYTQCIPEPDRHIKTIVNTFYLDGVAVHPHNFHYRDDMRTQNENGHAIETEWRVHPSCREPWRQPRDVVRTGLCHKEAGAEKHSEDFDTCCSAMPGAISRHSSVERVALFHYATKSWEDFSAKMVRGSGMSRSKKTRAHFDKIAKKQTSDNMCKEVAPLWQSCCSPQALEEVVEAKARRFW